MKTLLTLYAIRNKKGLYYRSKGLNGRGDTWVPLEKARIYPKITQARAQITFFAKNYPTFGAPDLVALNVNDIDLVEEGGRVKKAVKASRLKDEKHQQHLNSLKL